MHRAVVVMIIGLLAAACGDDVDDRGAGASPTTIEPGDLELIDACVLIDVGDAGRVLGPGVQDPNGDGPEPVCVYLNADGTVRLTIDVQPGELYDTLSILEPHTVVPIGSEGRSNADGFGNSAVQFLDRGYSVTLSTADSVNETSDLTAELTTAARTAASRLP